MNTHLVAMTVDQVCGINRGCIRQSRRADPTSQEQHCLVKSNELSSCITSVFFRDHRGTYLSLPIELMAAKLLHRVAQGQFFITANKRTALTTCYFFLRNNGYSLHVDHTAMDRLLWGFAGTDTRPAKYDEGDALEYIVDHIS